MMTLDQIYEEAAAWLARQQDDAMDWDGFTQWLEADPRHRPAYDELALINLRLDDQSDRISLELANEDLHPGDRPAHVRWSRWAVLGGSAIAAGLALVLWLQPRYHETAAHDYRSAPGRIVSVAFGDGTRIILAPASKVTIRGQRIDLQGSAFFEVPHRSGRTLDVNVGDFQVTDVGTRFSVEDEPEAVSVQVAEGSVAVSSDKLSRPVSLSAGQGLVADRPRQTIRLTAVDPQQVASWRIGKLQFDDASLALVAQEISRYSSEKVTVDPTIANQPFSGVIAIDHGKAPAQTLAQILSLELKTVDGAERLQPRRK